MTTGRGFIVCAATLCALLSSCSSTSLVACKTEADCAPYAGTVCYEGYCRKPSTISGDVDFAMMSMPEDMAATPEPPDLSLFCGDGGLTSCPAATPVCDDTECRACTSADNSVCAARSILTPVCDATSGVCAACTTNTDCTDATNDTCSFDGSCRPACSTNTDCTSGICDYGTFNGTAVCARADEIVYVSSACGATRDGSQANPYCSLDGAVTKLPSGGFIRVLASTTTTIAPSTQPFAHPYVIVGDSNNSLGSNAAATGLTITSGGNVLVYGLDLLGLSTGILCTGGKLRTLHDQIATSAVGIDATDCTLNIDSTWLSQNGTGASLHGSSSMQMTNTIVSDNTKVGLALDGAASAFLSFDTVANNTNTAGTVGAIANSSTSSGTRVYNSIVFGNTQVGGQSWSGIVTFANCDSDSSAAATYATAPKFVVNLVGTTVGQIRSVNTYHLVLNDTNNAACCVDKGKSPLNLSPAPKTDYDGQTRPIGAGYDIGADEVQ